MQKDIKAMKTSKGKANRINDFFWTLEAHTDKMQTKNLERLQLYRAECDKVIARWEIVPPQQSEASLPKQVKTQKIDESKNYANIPPDDVIALHFHYLQEIELAYRQREIPEMLDICIEYCLKDIELYPQFKEAYLRQRKRELTRPTYSNERRNEIQRTNAARIAQMERENVLDIRIPSFQRLVMIYEKQGNFEEAIKICELAISYNLHDSTKGGFDGRIEKLQRKMEPPQAKKRNLSEPRQVEPEKIIVSVDTDSLKKIRKDALVTQERLIVEDAPDFIAPHPFKEQNSSQPLISAPEKPIDVWEAFKVSLSQTETDALTIILQSGDINTFANKEGIMLEVLVDSINEKASDIIGDCILDLADTLEIYPEYENDLKALA